jgi:hypothetical protein
MRIQTKSGMKLEIIDGHIIFPTLDTKLSLDQLMNDDSEISYSSEMRDLIKETRMLIKSEGLY